MRAYILVKVKTGREREALDALQGIAALEEVDVLFGEYDYIVVLQAEDTAALARLVTMRVRKAPGAIQTTTLLEAPLG